MIQYLGAALAMGLAASGAALGIGFLVGKTMESIARQPEVGAQLRTTMLIAIAFVEALALYTLVVSLLLVLTK